MGAGARLAEERDRWPDEWQVTDLEQEAEHLLELLDRTEELRAAVPGYRISGANRVRTVRTSAPVLVGITDRRVLVVGRWPVADADRRPSIEEDHAMSSVTVLVRADGRLELPGDAELDLEPCLVSHLRTHVERFTPASAAS